MELKITTLIENQPGQDGRLAFEHGLSLFIEFAGKRLLFDTGQTGAFADNAEKLSIDLSQLDAVILSHGHYDHSGGLARLLPLLSPGTPIYAGKEFFAAKYKKLPGDRFQYNGNPFPREIFASYPVRLHLLEAGISALSPDILLFKNFDWSFPFEKPNPRFYTGDASDERIRASIDAFRELQIRQIAVSHCTGLKGEALLRDAFPGQFIPNHTGNIYQL